MRKTYLFLIIFIFIPANFAFSLFEQIQWPDDVYMKRVVVSGFNPSLIYAVSKNSLYTGGYFSKETKKLNER